MYRVFVVSAVLLTASAGAAVAQHPRGAVKLSDVVGEWDYKAIVGGTKGFVVASVLRATASKDGWTIQHASESAIPLRVVAVGGDSIVAEGGPYPSTLRPGQTVERNHIVLHYDGGNRMKGAFDAHYSSGGVIRGRVDAVRRR